ncbi:hypothetical protein [Nocardia sp. NBC_00416]|uniref:hypothetical protein n=1 Tax=Nocardia sp. NBC_00416 TaxID=2975991 RepID=UPI002E23E34B
MASRSGRRAVLDVEAGGPAAIALSERTGWTRIHSARGDWFTSDGRATLLHHYLSP